jgi:hypothetical protein
LILLENDEPNAGWVVNLTNDDLRVLASGTPISQLPIRTRLIAAPTEDVFQSSFG